MPPGCSADQGVPPPGRSARASPPAPAGPGRIIRLNRAELSPITDHHTTAPSSHDRARTGTAFLLATSHVTGRPGPSGRDGFARP